MKKWVFVCLVVFGGPRFHPAGGEEPLAQVSLPVLEGDNVRVGGVLIDPVTRVLTVTGWVNQASGDIELLACGPGGKTHESVFLFPVHPLDVYTALLLVGLKPGKGPEEAGKGRPEGPELNMRASWSLGGTNLTAAAQDFLHHIEQKGTPKDAAWAFTGSRIEDGKLMALSEESLVATYWDPWALINLTSESGAHDEMLVVNEALCPPVGTAIRFSISRAPGPD